MKKIGTTDSKWSLQEAIKKQVEVEDRIAWAKKPVEPLKYEYKPSTFNLTFAAKHAFTRGISLFKL